MLVSKNWLKELITIDNFPTLEELLPLRTIATKEITDKFIELDMKGYNRADLLSLRGVALEIGSILPTNLKFNQQEEEEEGYSWENKQLEQVAVDVQNPNICPIYCVAKIEGIQVKQNPKIKQYLEESGMRSIDPIVDITNFVMLEYGQPLHAFSAQNIKEEKLVVRTAKKGEQLVTLDNKKHELADTDIVIADPENVVGLAGVMGGKISEISKDDTTILLEAAVFDSKLIRQTANRHNLSSESSKRFIHGLTKKRLFQALDKAIKLLGGRLTGLTIMDNLEEPKLKINISLGKVRSLIGVNLEPDQIEEYLSRLYFKVTTIDNSSYSTTWQVEPPYWRLDIKIEEDVIEEIARMYGYENVAAKQLAGELPKNIDQSFFDIIDKLKQQLVNQGLTEVQTYSFYSTKVLNSIGWAPDNLHYLVKVANPISSETEYMRQNIWQNLVEVIDKNIRQGFEDIAIFEVGKVYIPGKDGQLPEEKYCLSIALMSGDEKVFNEVYQLFIQLNDALKLGLTEKDIDKQIKVEPSLHPNRMIHLEKEGKTLGGISEVHKRVLDKFGISKRVAILEIYLEQLF